MAERPRCPISETRASATLLTELGLLHIGVFRVTSACCARSSTATVAAIERHAFSVPCCMSYTRRTCFISSGRVPGPGRLIRAVLDDVARPGLGHRRATGLPGSEW